MAGFVGRYEHSLDIKGRVILPAKFRAQFEKGGYLAQQSEGCLALWTPGEFDRQMAVMQERAESGRSNRNRARLWASTSHEVEIDRQGRMAIPAHLRQFAALDSEVQRQLVSLAGAIARHIVRRELKTQPDEIVAVIRETVALLPMTARDIRVHLNPEDAKLVRSRVVEAGSDRSWNVAEDPLISRGGCRVSSENSTIDATLEQRLGAAIAAALGDSRAPDAQEGA